MPNQTRRLFLTATTAAAAAATLPGCASRMQSSATPRADVIILGAGLAGLNAGLILEAAGMKVTVLEASNRIGGRVYTLDDVPGTPETGGTQIGMAYKRVVDTAKKLGLTLIPNGRSPLLSEDSITYYIKGQRMTRTEWAASSLNPFQDAQRNMPPDRLLGRLIGPSPLASVNAWRDEASAIYDTSSLAHLRAKGLSPEVLRLLQINNSYGDSLADTSLLNLYHAQSNITEIMKTPGPILGIAGGNQRLPEAMAGKLSSPVTLNKRVVSVSRDERGVEIICADGSKYQARFAICTLPLPAMRGVTFTPALSDRVATAVQQVPYARITQLHLAVSKQFWKDDGRAPFLWSDGLLKRVFPSDPLASGNPQTLTVWVNGPETANWDKLSLQEAEALALKEMQRIFPASEGALRLAKRVSWHGNTLAGGAWVNWSPGQISQFARAVAAPIGRLHFAGEHCAPGVRGLEGAMASGEVAAQKIIAELKV